MNIPFHAVEADVWIQITSPHDLGKAEQIMNEVAKKDHS